MRLALLPRHLTHLTDGHRRPRHLHRPDAASGRGSGRERRQSRRAPRRGRGRRHPGQRRGASDDDDALFANGDATRVRRPGGSIGTPSRQDPRSRRRHGSSHLDRVDRSPRVSRDPAPRAASRRRVATDLRTRVRWQTCAFSRHVSSRRFAAPPRASPRPHFASDQSPPRELFHVFSLRRTPARPPR